MKIVCYGDSNTYGWDPSYFSGNHYAHPWPELMAKMTGHEVVNCGEPGRMVPNREESFQWFRRDVKAANPDLLLIMLGTNDIFYNIEPFPCAVREELADAVRARLQTADLIVGRMDAMIRYTIQNRLADNILLLSCPKVRIPEEDLLPILEGMSEGYHRIAEKEQIGFADPFRWDIPLSFDGVHFAEEGHKIFAEKISQVIRKQYQ